MPMDKWPQLFEGQWLSPDGHWACAKRREDHIADNIQEFQQRVGQEAMRLIESPQDALVALQWHGHHIQISRDVPGGPLTIKEVTNAREA